MLNGLRNFMAALVSADYYTRPTAALMEKTLRWVIVVLVSMTALLMLVSENRWLFLGLIGTVTVVLLIALGMVRRGYTQAAGWLVIVLVWAVLTFNLGVWGGVRAVGPGYYILMFSGALLVGMAGGFLISLLIVAALTGLYLVEVYTGWLPEFNQQSTLEAWINNSAGLIIVAIMIHYMMRRVYEAMQRMVAAENSYRAAEMDLASLQDFQRMVTSLSTHFINLTVEEIDPAISRAIQEVVHYIDGDYGRVWLAEDGEVRVTHLWYREGYQPNQAPPPAQEIYNRLARSAPTFDIISVADVTKMGAGDLKDQLAGMGLKAAMAIPLVSGGVLMGFMAVNDVRQAREWSQNVLALLKVVGEIVGNALQRKQAHSRLQESETRFRMLVENSPTGIYLVNSHYTITYVNQVLAEITGYAPAELIGKDFRETPMLQDSRDTLTEYYQRRARGEEVPRQYEILFRTKDSVPRWAEMKIAFITTPDGEHLTMGQFVDITERKEAVEALTQSEEKFRSLVENSPVGIFIIDDNLRFLYVNDEYCTILGYPRDELIGRQYGVLLEDTWLKTLTGYHERRKNNEDVPSRYEFVFVRKDGEKRWGEHTVSVIQDVGGYRCTIGQLMDITTHKEAENRERELALTREKVDLLRTFIGNISHDIKTPLTTINTSLYLLEYQQDPEKQKEDLRLIQSQTERLQSLIQNLLTISRLEYLPDLLRQATDVNLLMAEVVWQVRPSAERKHLEIVQDYAPDLPLVEIDPDEFKRALINLVENAINYTPDGRMVRLQTAHRNEYVVIGVIDTGIGIHQQDLPHIFERFYRASEARSKLRSGSGLGLAIVKRIMEMHHAEIEVNSRPNEGTEFYIRVPLVAEAIH